MQIDFEQSGGFANIAFRFSADLGELPEETATELRRLVEASGILAAAPPSAEATPAGLTYRVRVSDGPRNWSWNGTDATMTEALSPLIDRLSELAVEAAKQRGKQQ